MLRADTLMGRLVTALSALPPEAPPVRLDRPWSRLAVALAARPRCGGDGKNGGDGGITEPRRITSGPRARWLPALATTLGVMTTCLAAAAAQGVLPDPWKGVAPSHLREASSSERWHLVSNGRLTPQPHIGAVVFTPPSGQLLVTLSADEMSTWDMTDPEHPERIGFERHKAGQITAVGVTPDGRTVVTADGHGMTGQRVDTGEAAWTVADGVKGVKAIQAEPHTVKFAVADSTGSTLLRDVPVGKEPRGGSTSRLPLTARSAQFSRDGRTLAVADPDGEVRLWDVSQPRTPTIKGNPFRPGGGSTTALAFSPDGRLLATVDGYRTVHLWDVSDAAKPRYLGRPIPNDRSRIVTLAFSPDTRLLATVSADGTASLWWRTRVPEADVPPGATAQ
ncbi:WD40 repeat domain-containing protein [Streptomyces sp. NPDC048254]|uniref:WD40 repeat domain-containing protein n=1 Tax=Streptomyces sp. NPDC048254 TaxID=3365525 RepID=UPI00371E7402